MAAPKYWNGSEWAYVNVGPQGPTGPTGPSGTEGIVVSATEPVAPYEGLVWIDSSTDVTAAAGTVPTGSVNAFAGATAPGGWLLCDGAAVSRATYAALFAVIGTTYGAGDGSTTFALPNLKGRVPVGVNAAETEFDTLGESGGSKTSTAPHTHAIDHDHPSFTSGTNSVVQYDQYAGADRAVTAGGMNLLADVAETHTHTIDVPAFAGTSGASSAEAASGNLQPYLALNYIIRT